MYVVCSKNFSFIDIHQIQRESVEISDNFLTTTCASADLNGDVPSAATFSV